MKVLIGAVAAAMILCGSAAAQTETNPAPATPPAATTVQVPASRCGEFTAAPTPPEGRRVSVDDMTAQMAAFERWVADYRTNLTCRRTEAEELQATSVRRREEHNTGAQALNTTLQAWDAEVAQFNSRQSRRGRQ